MDRLSLVATRSDAVQADFAQEVSAGLSATPKSLPCRFLYDEEGSRIFEEITELPEYYLTRTESSILQRASGEIVAACETPLTLVELGSGSAEKTRHLIEAILAAQGELTFVPVDISPSALEQSSHALLDSYPALEIVGFACEYEEGLRRLDEAVSGPRLIAWLGSNIGNLEYGEAREFLTRVRGLMHPRDRLLVGIDLHKDSAILEPAYNDSAGVSARFNLNLLARINRELGGDADLDGFRHEAIYDREAGRVVMNLVSLRDQTIEIAVLGRKVRVAKGERIHTEYSHKFRRQQIVQLAGEAGFGLQRQWLDPRELFSENLLAPVAPA